MEGVGKEREEKKRTHHENVNLRLITAVKQDTSAPLPHEDLKEQEIKTHSFFQQNQIQYQYQLADIDRSIANRTGRRMSRFTAGGSIESIKRNLARWLNSMTSIISNRIEASHIKKGKKREGRRRKRGRENQSSHSINVNDLTQLSQLCTKMEDVNKPVDVNQYHEAI